MNKKEMNIIAEKEGKRQAQISALSRTMLQLEQDKKDAEYYHVKDAYDKAIEWVQGRREKVEDEQSAVYQLVTALGLNNVEEYTNAVKRWYMHYKLQSEDLTSYPVYRNAYTFFVEEADNIFI